MGKGINAKELTSTCCIGRMRGSENPPYAQVAELVDALASGASNRKVVEVQVLSWAPLHQNASKNQLFSLQKSRYFFHFL